MTAPGDALTPNRGGEEQRLATLAGYSVLESGRERHFDELTALASHLCATPVALVSLVDERELFLVAARAEKLRQKVESLELPLPEGRSCRSTISIGIAAYPEHGDVAGMLIAEVKHALRLAKAEGCNRVVVAPRGLDYRGTLQRPSAAA